jgi:ornithine cyclodeaminase/alanine dehydrogenase-like protein (mu-crystallin family)
MDFQYITEAEVEQRLTMPAVIIAVEEAFRALATGRAENVPRSRAKARGIVLHSMSASADYLGLVGWKQYTTTNHGAVFHVGVYDQESGHLKAMIEANRLGQMRTGATTGVAAKYLARADAQVLALIGSGWQAQSQLEAIATVRSLQEVRIFSRDPIRRRQFSETMVNRLQLPVRDVASSEEAIRGADMIVTCSSSRQPVIERSWLNGNQFIAAVGSNWLEKSELDVETIRGAQRVVCDSIEACQREAGELVAAAAAGAFRWEQAIPLSQIVSAGELSVVAGRTIFKSVGMAIEDLAAAALLLPST